MNNRVVDRKMKLKILTIIPIVTEIIALLFLPAQVPVHYNMSFQVTEYGSKYTLLVLGVVIVLMGLFMCWIYKTCVNKEYENVIYRLSSSTLVVFNIINLFFLYGSMFMGVDKDSIAIIGGADGPTAIFLAGKLDGSSIFTIFFCLIFVAGCIIFLFNKKKQ